MGIQSQCQPPTRWDNHTWMVTPEACQKDSLTPDCQATLELWSRYGPGPMGDIEEGGEASINHTADGVSVAGGSDTEG